MKALTPSSHQFWKGLLWQKPIHLVEFRNLHFPSCWIQMSPAYLLPAVVQKVDPSYQNVFRERLCCLSTFPQAEFSRPTPHQRIQAPFWSFQQVPMKHLCSGSGGLMWQSRDFHKWCQFHLSSEILQSSRYPFEG